MGLKRVPKIGILISILDPVPSQDNGSMGRRSQTDALILVCQSLSVNENITPVGKIGQSQVRERQIRQRPENLTGGSIDRTLNAAGYTERQKLQLPCHSLLWKSTAYRPDLYRKSERKSTVASREAV